MLHPQIVQTVTRLSDALSICRLTETRRYSEYGEPRPTQTPPLLLHTVSMYLGGCLAQVPERLRCPHDSYLQGFKDGIGSHPSISLDSGIVGRQSERTSQAVKTTMRYWISQGRTNWALLIPDLLHRLNDSRNELTCVSSNEYCHGFEVNESSTLLPPICRPSGLSSTGSSGRPGVRQPPHETALRRLHIPLELYLRLHKGYTIPGMTNSKFSQQRLGPFVIIERRRGNTCRMALPTG